MEEPIARLATGIPGLDHILGGGLFDAGVYIVQGPPGAGKTTLANQLCFNAVGRGAHALYVTMLAESHARMMQHMAAQSFFDASVIPSRMYFVSGYRPFETAGLKGVLELVRSELASHQASILVLDGLILSSGADGNSEALRRFVHELQSLASLFQCTVLILSSSIGRTADAETTMVDGVLALEERLVGSESERSLQVRKFRGSRVERGRHAFCITDDGLVFYPRLESLTGTPAAQTTGEEAVSTGVQGLDRILPRGGFATGSSVVVHGDAGSGKTLLGMSFLGRSTAEQPGLLFTFFESHSGVRAAGNQVGMDLDAAPVRVLCVHPHDETLDQFAYRLLHAVDHHGTRRVFIDGLAGMAGYPAFSERGFRFIGALLDQLQRRGATTLVSLDPAAMAAAGAGWPAVGLVSLFDYALELSHVQSETTQQRMLRMVKARGGSSDGRLREIRLHDAGLRLDGND